MSQGQLPNVELSYDAPAAFNTSSKIRSGDIKLEYSSPLPGFEPAAFGKVESAGVR